MLLAFFFAAEPVFALLIFFFCGSKSDSVSSSFSDLYLELFGVLSMLAVVFERFFGDSVFVSVNRFVPFVFSSFTFSGEWRSKTTLFSFGASFSTIVGVDATLSSVAMWPLSLIVSYSNASGITIRVASRDTYYRFGHEYGCFPTSRTNVARMVSGGEASNIKFVIDHRPISTQQ